MLLSSEEYARRFSVELQLLNIMRHRGSCLLREIVYGCDDCTIPAVRTRSSFVRCGQLGRPLIVLNIEHVEFLRSAGYTWHDVASIIGVSRTTIWRHLTSLGLDLVSFTDISDSQLDDTVKEIQHQYPNVGQIMLEGYLKEKGIKVQRYRIRESNARTDPLRRSLRWHEALTRRSYSVQGANSLWHIDGHHSLIRWRFVIHGGIDGYSRLVVYLACNTNNKAETVFKEFHKATQEYGMPKKVRSDKGGENMQVCYYMIAFHGPHQTSHIAGSSTHNQRIERLWRDVFRCVLCTFHELFYEMESIGILDADSDVDLFVLHCIFLPRIRKSLSDFTKAWNVHPLRTEHNWSPRKIWVNSIVRDCIDTTTPQNLDLYGSDPEGPLPEEECTTISVPPVVCPLEDGLDSFLESVDCSTIVDGLETATWLFTNTRSMLQNLLSSASQI